MSLSSLPVPESEPMVSPVTTSATAAAAGAPPVAAAAAATGGVPLAGVAPSAGKQSTPRTVWGLDPFQLYTRYWAAMGVQVVRQGEPDRKSVV